MIMRTVVGLLLIGFVVTGCATGRQKPPTLQVYELGMWRATYRDYAAAGQSICSSEPRWLQDEITSVNGVLGKFLEKTDNGYDGVWTPDDLDVLEQGGKTLPDVIAVHQKNLLELQDCGFGDDRGFPVMIRRGLEYARAAETRVREAEQIQAYVVAKIALQAWKADRPTRQYSARNRCPPRPRVGAAQVYYAFEDEDGLLKYLFCDGAKVIRKNGTLEFQEPVGMSRREKRRVKARNYLNAAKKWPRANLDLPPTLPAKGESAHAASGEEG